MAVFAYEAGSDLKTHVTGTVVADTPREARDQLRARGLTVHRVETCMTRAARTWLRSDRRLGHRQAQFLRELSTLLGAGVPVHDAIESIAEQYRGHFHAALLLLRERVCSGASLAEAMAEQPHVFDELCLTVTEVGENAGTLDRALEQLAEFKERAQQLRGRIGTALLYPAIVLTMGGGVTLLLMTYVVPDLLSALVAAGRPLPLATRAVKGLSDFLIVWWWAILLAVAAAAASIAIVLRTRAGRRRWHTVQLGLPLIGEMVRKQATIRVAVILSTLLKSGVVLERAVQIAQRSCTNVVLRHALERFEAALAAGQDLAPALSSTGAFPKTVVQMFAIGQQSGRLEEMLDRLAADYDRQLAVAAQRLTAVAEPLLIVGLAIVVGFIAFATILPILEAGNVL